MSSDKRLIVALDVPTLQKAKALIDQLGEAVSVYKIGSQLFTACGPAIVRYVQTLGKDVFLDLKFHDIPNTVANAVSSVVGLNSLPHEAITADGKGNKKHGSVFMCTVHTVGGREMLERSVEVATKTAEMNKVTRPLLVGITVLTSEAKTDNIRDIVLQRARLAKKSGLDGVVSSSHEAEMLRQEFGKDFIIVTPGIRLEGSDTQDQKRVATPTYAIEMGSSFLVVGRPIVKAENPKQAAEEILTELKHI